MKLLLDTHALLWLSDPDERDRVGRAARRAVEDPRNDLVVSAATAWEISTKHRLGRLPNGGRIVRDWARALDGLRATEAAVTSQHGLLAGGFDAPNRDPFDRIIAAQAITDGATLVTADRQMDGFGVDVLW